MWRLKKKIQRKREALGGSGLEEAEEKMQEDNRTRGQEIFVNKHALAQWPSVGVLQLLDMV